MKPETKALLTALAFFLSCVLFALVHDSVASSVPTSPSYLSATEKKEPVLTDQQKEQRKRMRRKIVERKGKGEPGK